MHSQPEVLGPGIGLNTDPVVEVVNGCVESRGGEVEAVVPHAMSVRGVQAADVEAIGADVDRGEPQDDDRRDEQR